LLVAKPSQPIVGLTWKFDGILTKIEQTYSAIVAAKRAGVPITHRHPDFFVGNNALEPVSASSMP
jgi:hypothetical protein